MALAIPCRQPEVRPLAATEISVIFQLFPAAPPLGASMPNQIAKIPSERGLLKEKAYLEIKTRIQNGTFAAGGFLSERQLATLFGMSKTPVKAALERLEQEGFVSVSPQQGIVVRELSIKEIADHFEIRKALEGFVVKAIAGNLTAKEISLFERNLKQQKNAAAKNAVAKLVELDAEFHMHLCEIFGNLSIVECLSQHRSKMHRVIFQVMVHAPGRMTDAVREHRGIFHAIRHNKMDAAVQLMDDHLEFGKQYLLSSRWS